MKELDISGEYYEDEPNDLIDEVLSPKLKKKERVIFASITPNDNSWFVRWFKSQHPKEKE